MSVTNLRQCTYVQLLSLKHKGGKRQLLLAHGHLHCCDLQHRAFSTNMQYAILQNCNVNAQDHSITACMLQVNLTLKLGPNKLNQSSSWEANMAICKTMIDKRRDASRRTYRPIITALHMTAFTCRKGKTC